MTDTDEVRFQEKLGRGSLVRTGIVVGAALVVALGVAVAMAASPSSPQTGASAGGSVTSTVVFDNGFNVGGSGGSRASEFGGWTFAGGTFGGDLRGFGHGRGHPFGQITITAISGSNLSLRTEDGWTRTITVADSTTITKGGQTISLADLKVGDTIRFAQTRNSDGTFTITRIDVVVPTIAGTVTAVSSSGFTIRDRDGLEGTVTTTSSTAYSVGSSAGSKADVKVGVGVVVAGTARTDGSFTATSVTVVLPRVAGEVTAKTGTTITLGRPDGTTLTVKIDSGTTYEVAGVTSPTLSDITVGMVVVVEGTQNADGSLQAEAVHAGPGFGLKVGPGMKGGRGFWGGSWGGPFFGPGGPDLPIVPTPSGAPESSTSAG